MERFFVDVSELSRDKAQELYEEVCVSLIEQNGLKENATDILLKLCDMNMKREQSKDPLFSTYSTWKDIKKECTKIRDREVEKM
jgi:hypothetical protein